MYVKKNQKNNSMFLNECSVFIYDMNLIIIIKQYLFLLSQKKVIYYPEIIFKNQENIIKHYAILK